MDVAVVREFRLLLRDFFDAQAEDWGDEANAPRFARIEAFLSEHEEARDELAELVLFAFLDVHGGICELCEALGARLNPDALAREIEEFGERRPRDVRTGYVRRMHEALQLGLDGNRAAPSRRQEDLGSPDR